MASDNIDLYVDEAYLLALINDELIPISDEKFAVQLHFQEALFSSSTLSPIFPTKDQTFSLITPKTEEPKQSPQKNREIGESSNSKLILCGICMEGKKIPEIFHGLKQCDHIYCTDCIIKYIASKIKENIVSIECPEPKCKQAIEPEKCSSILPKDVFGRWENALCESLVLGYQKFYCPFKDCSVLLADDGDEEVRQSECPYCRRLFCARCRVAWHVGVTCEEYQRLGSGERDNGDLMVMKLAKDKQWGRCSRCKFYVEKWDGCLHITCRCKYEFCYKCGSQWSTGHGGC